MLMRLPELYRVYMCVCMYTCKSMHMYRGLYKDTATMKKTFNGKAKRYGSKLSSTNLRAMI